MKCQTDSEPASNDVKEPDQVDDPPPADPEDVMGSNGNKQDPPDVALEWKDMTVSFRIVSDFDWDQDQKSRYELFPQFDSNAPSARTIPYMKRKANKERYNGSTLTSFLGHMPSDTLKNHENNHQDKHSSIKTSQESSPKLSLSPNDRLNGELIYRRRSSSEGIKTIQDPMEGPKKCHLCGKGFNKASYLKRHVMSHSSVKPYRCDICNWGFFQHCNLKRHMASHTLENGAAGFKCEHCSANFTTKSVLSVHLRDAHGDKLLTKKEAQRTATFDRTSPSSAPSNNFVNIGQKMVAKRPLVSRGGFPPRITVGRGGHMVARMGASPIKPLFRSRPPASSPHKIPSSSSTPPLLGVSNVNAHGVSGSVSANGWSRCTICNKSFLTPANLKQHMLLHPGSKPFRCNFCGMRFAQKINLKKHMVCHVAGNGHPCPHCNINFRTKEDVAQHVLKQHSSGGVTTSETIPRNMSASASSFQRQQQQRFRQRYISSEQPATHSNNVKIEQNRVSVSNEHRSNDERDKIHSEGPIAAAVEEEDEILDDEEEVEIPSPENSSSLAAEDHFIIQGNPVTSSAPQMVGGALPHLPPLPQSSPINKGGSYTCSICMESFEKVGLLNKHIIFNHSNDLTNAAKLNR